MSSTLSLWKNKSDFDYFRPKRVIGPISITHLYSNKYNKNIWLFGDVHYKASRCDVSKSETIEFAELVKKELIRNPNKLIDIFIESKYVTETGEYIITKEEPDTYLGEIIQHFEKCLQLDKTACAYKNARFHYIDIRQKQEETALFFDLLTVIILDFSKPNNFAQAYKSYLDLLSNFNYDMNKISDIINDFYFLNYIEKSKIMKQVENIKDIEVIKKILNHITKLIVEGVTKDKVRLIFNKIVKDIDNNNNDYDYTFYDKNSNLFFINSELVDMYMIARMFRNFKELPGKINEPAKNIIIYAGDAHVQRCVNFLINNLGFIVIREEFSNDNTKTFQCADISKIVFPLFKN
jgi:hypothetical protein